MKGSARQRAAAARVVGKVMTGTSLQAALPAEIARLDASGGEARVQALAYGSLRWFYRLDALCDALLSRPIRTSESDLRALVIVALYDLSYGHTPQHAVVNESVKAAALIGHGRARGLVNAVLRRFLRERTALCAAIDSAHSNRLSCPPWLLDMLRDDWPGDWESIAAACNAHPPMWLRVNSRRADPAEIRQHLAEALNMEVSAHPFCPQALCLEAPVSVSALPGFDAGSVSVQDAAAQMAALLLDARPGQRVLDACAAPGGKTAHIAELCNCEASVLALDNSETRLASVRENLTRLGLTGVDLRPGDALKPEDWWDGTMFDRILLDAPCSATGVIRRHPDIRLLRRPGDIPVMAATQLEMLRALWPLLRPGGRLLYATCSVLKQENERVIGSFLPETADAEAVSPPAAMPGRPAGEGHQILPGETGADGFYYACLFKKR